MAALRTAGPRAGAVGGAKRRGNYYTFKHRVVPQVSASSVFVGSLGKVCDIPAAHRNRPLLGGSKMIRVVTEPRIDQSELSDENEKIAKAAKRARIVPFLLLGLVLAIAVIVASISRLTAPDPVSIDLSAQASAPLPASDSASPRPLRIAVASMLTPSSNVVAYRALIDYVGETLGRRIEFVQRPTYAAVNALVENGDIDVAFVCSGAFLDLRDSGAAKVLAVPVVKGHRTYNSVIISRSSLPAKSLDELRSGSFALVDSMSNTGYYYPQWRLAQQGQTPASFFSKTTFTHSHETSILMVARGIVDGAAVDSLVFDAMQRQDPTLASKVNVVEESPDFAIPPVVATKFLAPDLAQRIQAALLAMHESSEGRAALANLGFDRFDIGRGEDYDSIAEMLAEVQGNI